MTLIIAGMRLLYGLLAAGIASLALAGCQAVDAPAEPGLKSRVDSSIMEAAEASEARGDNASAAGYYNSVYERDPENVRVAVGLSRNLRYVERPREAEAIMERALRKAPKDPALLAERGKVHLANLEAPMAVDVLSRAAVTDPDNWDVHTALAVGFDRMSLFEQAERHYQRAMALAPDNAVVLNNYGLSLAQRGDLKQAIEVLRRAASQPNATAKTRQNLAMLYALSGDLIRAEELVRRDLPPEMADKNMAHYRQLAANRRFTDPAAVTRAAAGRSSLGDSGVEAAPLPPLPGTVSTAPLQPEPPKPAPAATVAAAPAAAGEAKMAETKPAPGKVETMAPVRTGPPTPLTATPEAKDKPATPPAPKTAEADKVEKPTVAKAMPSKPSARAGTPYKLQLASFRREAQAMAARKLLQAQHKELLGDLSLEVSRINLGKRGDFFRVLSNPLASRAAAADLCRQLKTRNADCLLVRAEKP
ncbi:MAG: tetratricopeptide repeat protein [Alphaproteobacteria bacterium]